MLAHLVSSGVGPFYDGVAHLFVSPEDILVVVALALLGGLCGRPAAKWLVLVLPPAWLLGAALGHRLLVPAAPDWLIPVGALLTGLLATLNPRLPTVVPALLAGVLGLLHGSQNGRAMAATDTSFLAALGIAAAAALAVLLIAALCASLRQGWQTVTARALGSWIAAIALLSLAWQFRPDA